MYDTESEIADVASPHEVNAKNLFDDDDDETVDTAGFTVDRTLASFDTLVLNDNSAASSSISNPVMYRPKFSAWDPMSAMQLETPESCGSIRQFEIAPSASLRNAVMA